MTKYTFLRVTKDTRKRIWELQKKDITEPSVNKILSELLKGKGV